MQNLLHQLKTTLQSDSRLTIDGELVKNKIIELALAMDAGLIALLLDNATLKKHFFKDISGVVVFDKIAFQHFVSNKQFLPECYTAFKNKIGLTANRQYLTASNEVVLAWPYKDCTLQGGQTKEDQKRQEIFWHETLAADEIDRLLEPKVLTNFKQYDKDGEHTVENISLDDNLIVKGNNLLALHSLKKRYRGTVKLIYIDPPYNTGNDGFKYNDSFNHSSWLTFMHNRLDVARQLLRKDGVMFVQCDDNEQAYLKVLMDEVFGRDNFVGNIVAQTNPRGRSLDKYIAKTFEFINVYAKNAQHGTLHKILKNEKSLGEYNLLDAKGKYREMRLMNGNRFFNRKNRPNLWYPIYANPKTNKVSLEKDNDFWVEIFPINSSGNEQCWTWSKQKLIDENQLVLARENSKGIWRVYRKDYMAGQSLFTKQKSVWLDKQINHENGTEHLRNLNVDFPYPKSEDLIFKIVEMSTQEGDIVLDFFLGSATTATVAHKMGRQYIGIEQMDYIETVCVERLKKVISGEQGGISKDVNWHGGGAFTYCELTQHNANIIDKIEKAKTTKALQAIWKQIQNTDFLSYQVKPATINQHINEFKALSLQQQKQFLIAVLDKNQLYVNSTDIEDQDYQISATDKELNRQFYES